MENINLVSVIARLKLAQQLAEDLAIDLRNKISSCDSDKTAANLLMGIGHRLKKTHDHPSFWTLIQGFFKNVHTFYCC